MNTVQINSKAARQQAVDTVTISDGRKWYQGEGFGTQALNSVFSYGDKYFGSNIKNVMPSADFKVLVEAVTKLVQRTVNFEVKPWNIDMALRFAFNIDLLKKNGSINEIDNSVYDKTRKRVKLAYALYKLTK